MVDYREILFEEIANASENLKNYSVEVMELVNYTKNTGIINRADFRSYVRCVLAISQTHTLISTFNRGSSIRELAEKERELEVNLALAENALCELFKNFQKFGRGKPPEARN